MKATACGRKWSQPPPPRASRSSSAWIPASVPPRWCGAPPNSPSMSSSPTITCPTPICLPPSPSSIPIASTAAIPKKTSAAPAWHSNSLRHCSPRWAGRGTECAGSFLKPVAIATVADVVPLGGENRVMVKYGLNGLRDVRNIGLRALLDVAGFTRNTAPSARQVAFQIAPRINAAGRMDTAQAVIDLFLTTDPDRARALAQQLHDQNAERRQVEAAILEACERLPMDASTSALVYYSENWHRGVLGIVASRLIERFHRPVFVLGRNAGDGLVQGSGRSIPAFHLLNALESMRDLFVKFGGHEFAAGVTLEAARIEEFRVRFNACAAARLRPEDLEPTLDIDAIVDLGEITDAVTEELFALAPFGHGNPPPLFAALDVEVTAPPVVMKEKHLRITVRRDGRTLVLKAWNFAQRAAEFSPGARIDIAFAIEEDAYSASRGYAPWASILRDARPKGAMQTS